VRKILGILVTIGTQCVCPDSVGMEQPKQSNCPTLSSFDLGYYLCPHVGSNNPVPQTGVMIYKRDSQPGKLAGIQNLCSTISKTVVQPLKQPDTTYAGRESDAHPGTLVCKYTLPSKWVKLTGEAHFTMTTAIHSPHDLERTFCPILKYDQMIEAQCGGKYQLPDGPEGVW
jgi:hypothetical protein